MKFRNCLFLLAVLMFGCQSAVKGAQECQAVDWYELGRRDGASGKDITALDKHAESCPILKTADLGVRYRTGRQAGLAEFCEPHNGAELGRSGQAYTMGVCPSEYEAEFIQNYMRGQRVYQLLQANKMISKKIGSLLEEANSDFTLAQRQSDIESEIKELRKTRSENILEMTRLDK